VSHETIYRSLFVQARGVLKKELLSHLRSKRSMRRSQPVDPNGDRRGHIKDIVSIRQRPAAVEDRAVPGHWEGDLLSGPNNSYIATLVERQSNLSFPATACRSRGLFANLQHFGRRARAQAFSSASAAR
jgi:IS30 family transposase